MAGLIRSRRTVLVAAGVVALVVVGAAGWVVFLRPSDSAAAAVTYRSTAVSTGTLRQTVAATGTVEAKVSAATADLAGATLTAPFAGTVTSVGLPATASLRPARPAPARR